MIRTDQERRGTVGRRREKGTPRNSRTERERQDRPVCAGPKRCLGQREGEKWGKPTSRPKSRIYIDHDRAGAALFLG